MLCFSGEVNAVSDKGCVCLGTGRASSDLPHVVQALHAHKIYCGLENLSPSVPLYDFKADKNLV